MPPNQRADPQGQGPRSVQPRRERGRPDQTESEMKGSLAEAAGSLVSLFSNSRSP